MASSRIAEIIESVRDGDRSALQQFDWSQVPALHASLQALGPVSELTAHDVDAFVKAFRGSRDHLGYLLHALAGTNKDIHRMPESFPETVKSLDSVLELPPSERLRGIDRAAAVSDSVGELHWLLMMQLSQLGRARWLIDPSWADANSGDPGAFDGLSARLISFAVQGANFRLADDWVVLDTANPDGEPGVRFGWTDEDKESIVWCDSPEELAQATQDANKKFAVVRSFASIPMFYASRMLEGVVVFRRGAQEWSWESVNGLTPLAWQERLMQQGVGAATVESVQRYYDTLRTRLLPGYPGQREGDLLISMAFSVVPRALGASGRRAATVFAKLLLGGSHMAEPPMSSEQMHSLALGLWQSVNQLKVPVLRRLTAEVIDNTNDKSARLAQQAVVFDELRLRLRDLSRDASALEQKTRELNLQFAGSPLDMDLPYAPVAQLFDESYALKSRYHLPIPIKHHGDKYLTQDAQWVLCAALSDLMGQPREVEPGAVGAREGGAAWNFLADAERQLELRLDLLIHGMENKVWGADHIAALVAPVTSHRIPFLADTRKEYDDLRSYLGQQPQGALANLKWRFFNLGRRGRGRTLHLHVLAPRLPMRLIGEMTLPRNQPLWDQKLWDTSAFTSPASLLMFLRSYYEKVTGRRLEHAHPLRVLSQHRCELSKLRCEAGNTAWRFNFAMQDARPYYLEAQFASDLARFSDELYESAVEPSIQGRGDTLGPFTDLLKSVRRDCLARLKPVFADGALSIEIGHNNDGQEFMMRINTSPTSVEIVQERCR